MLAIAFTLVEPPRPTLMSRASLRPIMHISRESLADARLFPVMVLSAGIFAVGIVGIWGYFSGVYDLSGNVWEWEDSCTGTGQSATCRVRGGFFGADSLPSADLACRSGGVYARNYAYGLSKFGFRCCAP